MMQAIRIGALGGLAALALACGGGQQAKAPARDKAAVAASASTPSASTSAPNASASLPASALRRSEVRAVVNAGLGAFLQRVTLDDQPAFLGGKFHGFRIAALRGDTWRGVDLRPGDVITRVNGFPIEHPEEALEAFKSLEVASELRVDYERDGAPRVLRYTIVDDEPPQKQADASVR